MRMRATLTLLLLLKMARNDKRASVCVLASESESDDLDLEPNVKNEATNDTETIKEVADDETVNLAVKDVAYYLRAHKFNEYDRRFYLSENETSTGFFVAFPDPPLRSLHWEVHQSCEAGFEECLQYLHEKVLLTDHRRTDDTATIAWDQHWTMTNNSEKIEAADAECQRLRRLDLIGAQPFQGPLERFQWRTTASYYMCWFTMKQVPALTLFGEPCDNFANCLDKDFGVSNRDPKANDRLSFQCASYSFCPDPCCPQKHVSNITNCWHQPENPCFAESPEDARQCFLKGDDNHELKSIALNKWNTSCVCRKEGFQWDARYGMCVDVDECSRKMDTCNHTTEACFNLPGSYRCGCRWGYLFDPDQKHCIRTYMLLVPDTPTMEWPEEQKSPSVIKNIVSQLAPPRPSTGAAPRSVMGFIAVQMLLLQTAGAML